MQESEIKVREMPDMNNLILYTTEDGKSQIKLRADVGTVWLTQLDMAELFDATKQNISLHLKNLFSDEEFRPSCNCQGILDSSIRGGSTGTVSRRAIQPRCNSGCWLSGALATWGAGQSFTP